jgi:hypothetical protein
LVSILELKAKVEIEAGFVSRLCTLYLPEVDRPLGDNITLVHCGMPSKLYMVTLHEVNIADMVGVRPDQLTDAQLAKACSTSKGKAGDIIDLAGCHALQDVSCLLWLEQMYVLDISGCKRIDAMTVAKVIMART